MSDREVSGPIAWNETIWLNAMRAFCAGIVWAILITCGTIQGPPGTFTMATWTIPLVMPFIFFLLAGIIVGVMLPIFRAFGHEYIVGPSILMLILMIAAGDPLLFVLRLWKQWLAPVQVFYPFNFKVFIYVVNPGGGERSAFDVSPVPPAPLTLVGVFGMFFLVTIVSPPPQPRYVNRPPSISHATASVASVVSRPTQQPPAAPQQAPEPTKQIAQTPMKEEKWIGSRDGKWEVRVQEGEELAPKPAKPWEPVKGNPYFTSRLLLRQKGQPGTERVLFEVGPGNEVDERAFLLHSITIAGWSPKADVLALNYQVNKPESCASWAYIVLVKRDGGYLIIDEKKALANLKAAGLKLEKPYNWSVSTIGFAKDGNLRVKVEGYSPYEDAPPVVVKKGQCSVAVLGRS